MLGHLPEQVRKYGLRHHWTMRMEDKNALPKSKKLFNFKNVPFTVPEFFQTNTCYHLVKTMHAGIDASYDVGTLFVLTKEFIEAGVSPSQIEESATSVKAVLLENDN